MEQLVKDSVEKAVEDIQLRLEDIVLVAVKDVITKDLEDAIKKSVSKAMLNGIDEALNKMTQKLATISAEANTANDVKKPNGSQTINKKHEKIESDDFHKTAPDQTKPSSNKASANEVEAGTAVEREICPGLKKSRFWSEEVGTTDAENEVGGCEKMKSLHPEAKTGDVATEGQTEKVKAKGVKAKGVNANGWKAKGVQMENKQAERSKSGDDKTMETCHGLKMSRFWSS